MSRNRKKHKKKKEKIISYSIKNSVQEVEDHFMYKIQNACDNCYHCETIGCLVMCHNEKSEKYNKEVDVAGICSHFKKGIYWEELENEKNKWNAS